MARRERYDGTYNSLDLSPGIDPGPTKTLRGWHGKAWTYNQAFVDGHAANQRVYMEGTEDEDGYAFHYRIENIYPDNPPVQTSSACVVIRGDGWQKDMLPASFIITGL